jgi:hypothetical protein
MISSRRRQVRPLAEARAWVALDLLAGGNRSCVASTPLDADLWRAALRNRCHAYAVAGP